jgi:phospholipase/carboxylesterase
MALEREPANLVRPAAGEPAGALILFHGRGVDEHDLHPLLDVFDPKRRLVGITPGGPLSLPPGGKHWYAVQSVGYPDPDTFFATYELLDGWLRTLPDQIGVPGERPILGGVSPGTVMSKARGLGRGRPAPAGILAMSGFMANVPGFEHDLDNRYGFPVAIYHGALDPVISAEYGHEARDRLMAAGADVLYRETPMPHTIDPRVIPELAAWVQARVPVVEMPS